MANSGFWRRYRNSWNRIRIPKPDPDPDPNGQLERGSGSATLLFAPTYNVPRWPMPTAVVGRGSVHGLEIGATFRLLFIETSWYLAIDLRQQFYTLQYVRTRWPSILFFFILGLIFLWNNVKNPNSYSGLLLAVYTARPNRSCNQFLNLLKQNFEEKPNRFGIRMLWGLWQVFQN